MNQSIITPIIKVEVMYVDGLFTMIFDGTKSEHRVFITSMSDMEKKTYDYTLLKIVFLRLAEVCLAIEYTATFDKDRFMWSNEVTYPCFLVLKLNMDGDVLIKHDGCVITFRERPWYRGNDAVDTANVRTYYDHRMNMCTPSIAHAISQANVQLTVGPVEQLIQTGYAEIRTYFANAVRDYFSGNSIAVEVDVSDFIQRFGCEKLGSYLTDVDFNCTYAPSTHVHTCVANVTATGVKVCDPSGDVIYEHAFDILIDGKCIRCIDTLSIKERLLLLSKQFDAIYQKVVRMNRSDDVDIDIVIKFDDRSQWVYDDRKDNHDSMYFVTEYVIKYDNADMGEGYKFVDADFMKCVTCYSRHIPRRSIACDSFTDYEFVDNKEYKRANAKYDVSSLSSSAHPNIDMSSSSANGSSSSMDT